MAGIFIDYGRILQNEEQPDSDLPDFRRFLLFSHCLPECPPQFGVLPLPNCGARAEQRFADVRELANSFVFKYHDAIAKLPGSTAVREMLVKDAAAYLDRLSADAAGDAALQRELAAAYLKLGDVQGGSAKKPETIFGKQNCQL